jgi:hypothetical protein
MAFCWQILLPFAFLQIIINGLVLVYDWPDWVLGVLSGTATIVLAVLIYREAQREVGGDAPRYQEVGSIS